MTLSRRALIHQVGRAGGVAAAYHTMAAMGLLAVPSARAGPPELPPGHGRRVIIIGAGIAGMVLAYELRNAGYKPRILEARARPGGRNWSLRGGDTVVETGGTQHVGWDREDHLYFNPGPARLPYHHVGILSYCRALGVPLEVMCNDNRAALMQDDHAFDGAPQLNRRVVNDARGHVAELAAKAIDQAALAQPVSTEDRERLRAFLRDFGALDKDWRIAARPAPGGRGRRTQRKAAPRTSRSISGGFWRRISGEDRCSSVSSPTWRRPCCNRSAAWAGSARRSVARWMASLLMGRW